MKRILHVLPPVLAVLVLAIGGATWAEDKDRPSDASKEWKIQADLVELSTDAAPCPCYDEKTGEIEHNCRFLTAMRINEGSVGDVKLDGARIVLAGDLSKDLSKMSISTLAVTYDKSMTDDQRRAFESILPRLYPQKWTRKLYSSAEIVWEDKKDDAVEVRIGDMGSMSVRLKRDDKGNIEIHKTTKYWLCRSKGGFAVCTGPMAFKHEAFEVSSPNGTGFRTSVEAGGKLDDKN
ncbi:MAG: DUF1326 domain-containing protein [Planctomycetes bacterium]|nr:DUF1326 domain-containing protein [Planctomycetota bacterium]